MTECTCFIHIVSLLATISSINFMFESLTYPVYMCVSITYCMQLDLNLAIIMLAIIR